jgi:hypothetical protein
MKYDIYLSGPMTGFPDFNYPTFNTAAAVLRGMGFVVFNPAENFGGDMTRERSEYMRVDIQAVLESKMLVALPLWAVSTGAVLEIRIAQEIGIRVMELQELVDEFNSGAAMIEAETEGEG